jgi:hypothetical protein
MSKRLVVYVAGPLSAPTPAERMENVEAACRAARKVLAKGHWAFVPHLNEFYDRMPWTSPLTYEQYLEWDLAILARCDALLYLGPSPGADRERTAAYCMGMPVYLSVDDLPAVEEEGRKESPACNEASIVLPGPGPNDWRKTVGTIPDDAITREMNAECAKIRERDRHNGDPWWRWAHLREYYADRRASPTAAAASGSTQAAAACAGCGLPLDGSERRKVAPPYKQTMWICDACGQTAWGAADFGGVG